MVLIFKKINSKCSKLIVDWWTNENNRNSGCEPRALRSKLFFVFFFSISSHAIQIQQYIIYIIIHALGSQHDIAINWVIELLISLPAAIAYHHNKYTTAQDARPQPRHFQRNRYSPCPSTSASSLACSKCRHFAIDYMAFHRQRYFFR